MLVYADGRIVGTVGGGHFEHKLIAEARGAIAARRPRRFQVHLTRDLGMCCGGAMDAFIEPLLAAPQLVIHGGGHVGQALARLAIDLEFEVTVVDAREDYSDPARFPGGVHCLEGEPERLLPQLPLGPDCYHLIVTHDHQLDQRILALLIDQDLAWLGLIGSRAKIARFFLRLRAAGVDPALFRRVSGPVGLDLGAETPAEIAVSIAAELVRVRRGSTRVPHSLSELPLQARGGDGRATPPKLECVDTAESDTSLQRSSS